jgi:hypothetical protein
MQRPGGITFLAVLCFLGALVCVLAALVFFLGFGLAGAGVKAAGAGTGGMAALMGLGAAGGVLFLIFGAIDVVVGVGLWKLCNWARILTIILTALALLMAGIGLLTSLLHFNLFVLVFQLIFVGIYILILWYMFQPHVKKAFGVA